MNSTKALRAIKTRIEDVKNQAKIFFPSQKVSKDNCKWCWAKQLSALRLFTFPAKFNQKVISTRQAKKEKRFIDVGEFNFFNGNENVSSKNDEKRTKREVKWSDDIFHILVSRWEICWIAVEFWWGFGVKMKKSFENKHLCTTFTSINPSQIYDKLLWKLRQFPMVCSRF